MTRNRLARASLALGIALSSLLAACGDDTAKEPVSGGVSLKTRPPTGTWTATHLLIQFKGSTRASPAVTRSKEQARALAESLRVETVAGAPFEDLILKYTDARDGNGQVQAQEGKPGRYKFGPGGAVPPFEQAVKETPVGKFAPAVVETPFGFHIIRRDV